MEPMADRWLKPAEAASYTGRHPATIRQAAAEGVLRSAQNGLRGHRRYRREWLDAWLRGEKAPVLIAAR
ncbi:MAG: helix-turn-helix domain-containing protein [Actinomycetes bacterium]